MSEPKYPGTPEVINGNGAVAYVMKHVCGGVIGYPITPSTEISETFEAARAEGQLNVWGKHPFFVETEGEHSAQGGALGAAMTGGNFISNASSSQGILYGLEEHYATVGKRIGGFVLQVAARVVTRASLNVMAGHDDIYSLIPTGYTILFASNQQEAADFAAISYRTSSLSLVPVANTMDGFATSHVMSGANLPEPALLKEYLGDPAGRIKCPTVAQEVLFGAKGRVWQLTRYLEKNAAKFGDANTATIKEFLASNGNLIEEDNAGEGIQHIDAYLPQELKAAFKRQWINAAPKGTRQLCPALVDPNNPGLIGPVQNQPDFQASAADYRAHFASAVPSLVRQAFVEYGQLTGRNYSPVVAYDCEDADYVMVGLGSITEDVRAVLPVLRAQGLKVGVVSVKLLQPFPEAELVAAIGNAKAITILERSDDTALTRAVTSALLHARAKAEAVARGEADPNPDLPALNAIPRITTAIFGLGGHDVQPRHIVAAYKKMAEPNPAPLIYLGSQFYIKNPTPSIAALQDKLRVAYPETELMALDTEPNPRVLPESAMRIRFHSVGGYGTIATGKLLTDILAGLLKMHSKSMPKYGSEKSGAATNYYITLSPEEVLVTNAELEDVEIVVAPDHMVFDHTNPLKGLVEGGTLLMQSDKTPLQVWRGLPAAARKTIREKGIKFFVIDAFGVARNHAPRPELEARMMGIAFIGAIVANVDRISGGAPREEIIERVRHEIDYKFGRKGADVVEGNMSVIKDGMQAEAIDYDAPDFVAVDAEPAVLKQPVLSGALTPSLAEPRGAGLFDPGYWDDIIARPFREGTISESPVFPGHGSFIPVGTGQGKNKGIFRRTAPLWNPDICTACMECTIVCPDDAIPNTVVEIASALTAAINASGAPAEALPALLEVAPTWGEAIRSTLLADNKARNIAALAATTATTLPSNVELTRHLAQIVTALENAPVARTRPIFDAMEKAGAGTGALYAVIVDPGKCTGCMQCVEVCPPGALTPQEQTDDTLGSLEYKFARLIDLPNSPERFTKGATAPGGDLKKVLLDRKNYYAMTGGHGACRGCGEVTSTHLLTALGRAFGDEKREAHIADLEALIAGLQGKLAEIGDSDTERTARINATIALLDKALYLAEAGPTGNGPSPTVIVNSTGCSSVYASTMPFSPYTDPWVNGLFQDAQPLASGAFEGIASQMNDEIKAARIARAELADGYTPTLEGALKTLAWRDYTPAELALLPYVVTISGDGAAFDIGFGAMSRVLAAGTPIKCVVLDTGAYSNTGGQASTASFTGQDSDLARFGKAHGGKKEVRKELGLLAAFHPHVYVASSSSAFHTHYLRTTAAMLGYNEGASLLVVYTPCGTENGFAEDLSAARAKEAVRSRIAPMFVHDPRLGSTLAERFSLDGNPDINGLWTTRTLQYFDDAQTLQSVKTPLTPAEFAFAEGRFARQFKKLPEGADGVPIAEYIELSEDEQVGKTPYILATDDSGKLFKACVSASIVALVEDRKHYWQTLQFLSGQSDAVKDVAHKAEIDALKKSYEAEAAAAPVAATADAAADDTDAMLDQIAAAMAELASVSGAPATSFGFFGGAAAPAGAAAAGAATASSSADAPASGKPPIWLADEDVPKCANCATCYQELPQLFETTTMLVDGVSKTVARMIPGSLDGLDVTPELLATFKRVRDTCDAEIIQ